MYKPDLSRFGIEIVEEDGRVYVRPSAESLVSREEALTLARSFGLRTDDRLDQERITNYEEWLHRRYPPLEVHLRLRIDADGVYPLEQLRPALKYILEKALREMWLGLKDKRKRESELLMKLLWEGLEINRG